MQSQLHIAEENQKELEGLAKFSPTSIVWFRKISKDHLRRMMSFNSLYSNGQRYDFIYKSEFIDSAFVWRIVYAPQLPTK